MINATDVAMGIAHIHQNAGTGFNSAIATIVDIDTAYYSISLSLNVLLTLMIVIRLAMHVRNIRKATGASNSSSGLHTAAAAVATMLVESCAIYAVALLAYVVSSNFQAWVVALFSPVVGSIQVRAVFVPSPRSSATSGRFRLIMVTHRSLLHT